MESKSLIVFDMDGVLIDVSSSYREAVRQTSRIFFAQAIGSGKLPDPLFSLADLAKIKQTGGLNNDWDLTAAVINLLFTRVRCPSVARPEDPWLRFDETICRCDVSELAGYLKEGKSPVYNLMERPAKPVMGFVKQMYAGDVGSGNIIKQIFQEIYLGKDLFESVYGMPSRHAPSKGLIERESMLIDPALLDILSRHHILAIATGRPRVEADVPLHRFKIGPFFKKVLTHDDCLTAEADIRRRDGRAVSLGKPHPWMLDTMAVAFNGRYSKCYYIGDMPDDMIAAAKAKANYTGIGVTISAPDKEKLTQDLIRAGAGDIINDFKEVTPAYFIRGSFIR